MGIANTHSFYPPPHIYEALLFFSLAKTQPFDGLHVETCPPGRKFRHRAAGSQGALVKPASHVNRLPAMKHSPLSTISLPPFETDLRTVFVQAQWRISWCSTWTLWWCFELCSRSGDRSSSGGECESTC